MQAWASRSTALALFVLASLAGIGPALAARPSASELLPASTFAFARIADAKDLYERFKQTAGGRMLEDPQLRPLIQQLYGSAATALKDADEKLEVTLDQLVAIPQGEIAVAIVAMEAGPPAIVGIVDVGENAAVAQRLLDRAGQALVESGSAQREETVGDVKLAVFEVGPNQRVMWGTRDGTVLVSSNLEAIRGLLARWDGGANKPAAEGDAKQQSALIENPSFTAIMKACRPARDEDVQLLWFADPIAGVKSIAQGNTSLQIGLAILPALGLDGFKGLGGSQSWAVGEFDQISHLHVLLEEPRSGVLEALALGSGDLAPERWVPGDVINYVSVHWDLDRTLKSVKKLVDSFQGEGGLSRMLKNRYSERLGVDVENEVLPVLDGRFTFINRLEEPGNLAGQGNLIAVKVKNSKTATELLDRVVAKLGGGDNVQKSSFGGTAYYSAPPTNADQPPSLRPGRPAVAVMGDYLLLCDRHTLLERVIATAADPTRGLSDSIEFKLISSKVSRLAGDAQPGMISFSRPEEGLRYFYQMASDPANRELLAQQAGNNRLLKALSSALDAHPLPPFEVLARYLAPGGGLVVNDETGFHMVSFTLKRN